MKIKLPLILSLTILLSGCSSPFSSNDESEVPEPEAIEEVILDDSTSVAPIVDERVSSVEVLPQDIKSLDFDASNEYYLKLKDLDTIVVDVSTEYSEDYNIEGITTTITTHTEYTESVTPQVIMMTTPRTTYRSSVSSASINTKIDEIAEALKSIAVQGTTYIVKAGDNTQTIYTEEDGQWWYYNYYNGSIPVNGNTYCNLWILDEAPYPTDTKGVLQASGNNGEYLYTFYFNFRTKQLVKVIATNGDYVQEQVFKVRAEEPVRGIPSDVLNSAISMDDPNPSTMPTTTLSTNEIEVTSEVEAPFTPAVVSGDVAPEDHQITLVDEDVIGLTEEDAVDVSDSTELEDGLLISPVNQERLETISTNSSEQ